MFMASYSMRCGLRPGEVVNRALAFFERAPFDLEVSVRGDRCVRFADHGYVQVSVREGNKETIVELETRLWDDQVKQFMVTLKAVPAEVAGEGGS
jgi:hypothetical protein